MKVCIAEKPSVAKEIASIIGAKSRKDGYFEGNGYAVTWTFGHLCGLYSPDDYKPHWKKWSLDTLPMLPEKFETKVIKEKGIRKQFGIIRDLFKKADVVINCGDAGQEGELIQRWVLKEAKYNGPVQRLWISSLTNEAIRDGFQNLKPSKEFDPLYFAGSSRAIGDWLLGMNATRLYTLKYGGYKQVLSIGRVQTPTLAMLVERHLEIENFVSKPFWELQTKYRDVDFNYEEGRFEKIESGQELLEQCKDKPFKIVEVEEKDGNEYSPRLFDLTALQVNCNKRYGYSADQTLKLVQQLYEMKAVTYPRVDTTYLPEDQYPKIKGILNKLQIHKTLAAPLLNQNIKKSKRVFDNKKITDHHAIIPTGIEPKNLSGGLYNVYDVIVRRFLANFYPVCKVANTNVVGVVKIDNDQEIRFKTTGKVILEEGWRVLYPKKKNSKEEGKVLPKFEVGEEGPHEPELIEKKTSPPKYFTEATLLRAMETAGKSVDDEELRELMKANGIGRPSTRAAIIETLFKRKYIKRRKKLILPTDLGVSLIQTINNSLLKSVELTGQWEKKLREIEEGNYNPVVFIREMKKMVDELVTEVRMEKKKVITQAPNSKSKTSPPKKTASKSISSKQCPKCKSGNLLKGKSAYGCSRWNEGCDLRIPFKFLEKKISDTQLQKLLKQGHTTNLKGFTLDGQKVEGLIRFDDSFNIVFEPKREVKPAIPKCPKCQKGDIIKGKSSYGCSRWKHGCDFRFSFEKLKQEAKGQKLSKELALKIMSK